MSATKVYEEWRAKGVATPLDECVKGKFYNVLVGYSAYYREWFPIIPYPHNDAELGASWDHWHYDTRFFTRVQLRCTGWPDGRSSGILPCKQGEAYVTETKVERLKCQRSELGGLPLRNNGALVFGAWAKGMIGKSCKGKKCPHRGNNMVERPGGLLECPLHGLFADAETEVVISRGIAVRRLEDASK